MLNLYAYISLNGSHVAIFAFRICSALCSGTRLQNEPFYVSLFGFRDLTNAMKSDMSWGGPVIGRL